jgi:hypothetical protein
VLQEDVILETDTAIVPSGVPYAIATDRFGEEGTPVSI